MRFQRAEFALKLDSLAAARQFFAGRFADADPTRENLWIAHVDEERRCLHLSHHVGDATGAAFPFGKILADAAQLGSAGIVIAHNHPSGDSTPSDSDCRATRRLASAVEAIDCAILDHLVFAGGGCTSFRRIGLL
jgi:DNA repair protein RadC